jgi:FMN phosphatase YigB (HAD superfamily)
MRARGVLFDLDGVLYNSHRLIPGKWPVSALMIYTSTAGDKLLAHTIAQPGKHDYLAVVQRDIATLSISSVMSEASRSQFPFSEFRSR